MTITTTAPSLSSAGISAPSYADVLAYLTAQYQSIYGSDVYLGSDSQDGQFLAIVAKSISDANAVTVAVYNSFSPVSAQGNSLSSNVKLNGLSRQVASNSTATVTIVGTAGTAIISGVVQDAAGNKWNLPASVNIPNAGQVSVTATCAVAGAISASPNTINSIITPQLGWQSCTNPAAAVLGSPVETDAALRKRQAASVAQPAQSTLAAIVGAVAAVPGVTRYAGYENPTASPDANGLPAYSIAIVAEGGDATAIAQAIANKKTVGIPTAGTTTQTVADLYGIPRAIKFYQVAEQRVVVNITLHAISGYTSAIGAEVQAAIADYINSIPVGGNVLMGRLYGPANLNGAADGLTYTVKTLTLGLYGGSQAAADIAIAFNQAAHCDPSDVIITLA